VTIQRRSSAAVLTRSSNVAKLDDDDGTGCEEGIEGREGLKRSRAETF
jgi:hypothetical protein